MEQIIDIVVTPEIAANMQLIKNVVAEKAGIAEPIYCTLVKRSIDARSRQIKVNLRVKFDTIPLKET
ncbi:MAG: hypothetical protein WBP43_06905, partial [Chitinophagales bacterium]